MRIISIQKIGYIFAKQKHLAWYIFSLVAVVSSIYNELQIYN